MLGRPFPRAAGVARRQHADAGQVVAIFFAFDHNHGPRRLGQQFRQPIGNHAHTFDGPRPNRRPASGRRCLKSFGS